MKFKIILTSVALFLFSVGAFAQVPVVSPVPLASPSASVAPSVVSPSVAPVVVAPVVSAPNPASDAFLAQVVQTIKTWGGLAALLRIAAIIALIIASMKVTIINKLVWSKLGSFQVYVAPVLGLVGGLLSIGVKGPVTLASVFTYVSAGAGAVFLHEILDSVKAIPGLGAIFVSAINAVEGTLGGPAAQAQVAESAPTPPPAA